MYKLISLQFRQYVQATLLGFLGLAISTANVFAAECFDKATDDPKAGNVTAIVGPEIGVLNQQASDFKRPTDGGDIYSGDRVRTGLKSYLQVKLCDWSTYTFAPESESAITDFYETRGAGRRRIVNFIRGAFRFGSGRDTEPGTTEVNLQETGVTLGVRGTNILVAELEGLLYVILEGPSSGNSGYERRGLVEFWQGTRENIIAKLKRPGFAVTIDESGVSRPFRLSEEQRGRIFTLFFRPDDLPNPRENNQGLSRPERDSGQLTQNGVLEIDANAYANTVAEDEILFAPLVTDGLAPFSVDFTTVLTVPELEMTGQLFFPTGLIVGVGIDGSTQAYNPATMYKSVSYVQLELDFTNRTIGGENSFIAGTAAVAGQPASGLVFLDQPIGFDDGLFDLALYPLLSLTNEPDLSNGQILITPFLVSDISATISTDSDLDFFTEIIAPGFSTTEPSLSAISALDEFGMTVPGQGTFHYEKSMPGFASVTQSGQTYFGSSFASIDISFANRTIGGGNSFINVDISTAGVNFTENIFVVSFDRAVDNYGVFGLSAADFSGNNIESALFLINNGPASETASGADLYFSFIDTGGDDGLGTVPRLELMNGLSQ